MLQSIAAAVPWNEVAALFNLEDPDERFMVGVMLRFHGEERLYLAHALKRTEGDKGRVVVEIASFDPPARPRIYPSGIGASHQPERTGLKPTPSFAESAWQTER